MATREDGIPKTRQAERSLAEVIRELASATEEGLDPEQERRFEDMTLADVIRSLHDAPLGFVELTGPPPTVVEELGSGFLEGTLTPFKFLRGEPEEVDSNHPVARTVGELGGILVGFIPFIKGSQITVRGLGLLKEAPLLRAMLEGALGFGTFEAGAGEPELGKVRDRFLAGAAIGSAGELILFPFLNKSRSIRSAAEEIAAPRPGVLEKFRRSIRIDPDALNIERQIHPGFVKNPDEVLTRMKELSKDQQLEEAAARIAQIYRPGGALIIPMVRKPDRLVNALKGVVDEASLSFRRVGRKFEVLIADSQTRTRIGKAVATERPPAIQFLGTEGVPALTFKDAIRLIEMDTPKEAGVSVKLTHPTKIDPKHYPYLKGQIRYNPPEIAVASIEPTAAQYETLIHEYSHHLQTFVQKRNIEAENIQMVREAFGGEGVLRSVRTTHRVLSTTGRDVDPLLREIERTARSGEEVVSTGYSLRRWGMYVSDDEVAQAMGEIAADAPSGAIPGLHVAVARKAVRARDISPPSFDEIFRVRSTRFPRERVDVVERTESLMREFHEMTIEVVRRATRLDRNATIALIARDAEYYALDDELITRAIELMFIDPVAAKKIGPRAFRMLSRLINRESPKLRAMLSKGEMININDWLTGIAKREVRQFEKFALELTEANKSQWVREGGFRGLEVLHNGLPKEWLSLDRKTGILAARNLATGEIERIPIEAVQRPMLVNVARATEESTRVARQAFENPPDWVGLMLSDEVAGGVRPAVLDLEDFLVIRNGREGLLKWARANIEAKPGARVELAEGTLRDLTNNPNFLTFLRERGIKGVLAEDSGLWTVTIADRGALRISDDVLYEGFRAASPIRIGEDVIDLNFEDVVKSMLRHQRVDERELEHLYQIARREFNEDLARFLDPEVKETLARSRQELARQLDEGLEGAAVEDLETFAGRSNLKADRTSDGEWVISNPADNVELAKFVDEGEAREFIRKAGPDTAEDLAPGQVPTDLIPGSGGGGGPPPKFQQTFPDIVPPEPGGFLQRLFDFHALFAPVLTALENFAKTAERTGIGAAFTRVFDPAQKAILRVHDEMGGVAREALEGKTFRQQIELIQTIASRVPRRRFSTVIGWVENLSREEIEAVDGLMKRGMTGVEKNVAKIFEQLGLQNQVPRLLSLSKMMARRLENKEKFLARWRELQRQDLEPQLRAQLEELARMAEKPETLDDMFNLLGLSKEERVGIELINKYSRKKLDEFSILAVGRWLDAKPLGAGFKDGRAQYAALHKMTPRELELGRQLDRLFEASFEASGLNAKRQIRGYWPHLRKWTEHGIIQPEFLKRQLPPETIEWYSRRYRSGELSLYDTDPVMTAYKHLRNLFMKKHFDPVLPGIHEELKNIKAVDLRVHAIMNEYLHELMGRPHRTFERLNNALASSLRTFGHKAPERFAERLINEFTSLMYSATIPFRPALIVRNYWQMVQMIPPRIGFRDFLGGLEDALTRDGYEYAKRIGAIPSDVVPLMASTEVFTPQAMRPLGLKFRRLFDKGFEWYKKADDIGRAAAANGVRRRINRHIGRYMKDEISWEEFKQASKITTFDSVDVSLFESLFRSGRIEEGIDHLASTLAREAHFRYGHVNHPAGWGSVYGRLFGQFGTWPVQYKDFLIQGLARGTAKDKFDFLATHVAINGALLTAGAGIGMNLWSWVAFPSLNYTGGPMVDLAIDVSKAVSGSPAEQAMARRNLIFQFPTLDDPRSIFVPGSYFIGDLWSIFEAEGTPRDFFEAGGFRFYEPGEKSGFEWLYGHE